MYFFPRIQIRFNRSELINLLLQVLFHSLFFIMVSQFLLLLFIAFKLATVDAIGFNQAVGVGFLA